jgi:energy-coupling factor transporter transmembrane protein EcfT
VLFISLVLVQLLLRRQGDVYLEWYFLQVTESGVFYAFNSLLRYFVILLSATMLSNASPYEMIKSLRTWKLPETIIIMVSFTVQFLRQLQIDFRILNQNLKKRNITFKGKSLKARFELTSLLIIPIIGRLFSDIKYKVIAMELNGYGVTKPVVHFKYKKCNVIDYVFMMLYLIAVILILYK